MSRYLRIASIMLLGLALLLMGLTAPAMASKLYILAQGLPWDTQSLPNGRGLIAIKFFPSALNDVLVVRDTSATGPELFRAKDTAGGGLTDNSFGGLVCYPYIKPGDCTLGTPANARVMMLFIPTAI